MTGSDTLADTFEREALQPVVTDHGHEVATIDQEVVIPTSTVTSPMRSSEPFPSVREPNGR